MEIYKILRESENYMEFTTDLEEMLDELGSKVGELEFMHFSRHNLSLAQHWKTFSGTFKKVKSGATAIPDISCWRGATLILSELAYTTLEATLQPYGELLPITCNGETYYIFNCLTLASIDKKKSSQSPLDEGLIEFDNIAFEEDSIRGKLLFKSQEEGCTAIFCGDDFLNIVNSQNIKGIKFSENLSEIF
jgi:hypothetical protein